VTQRDNPEDKDLKMVEVKMCLCLTKYHAVKTYGGEWVYRSTHYLASALDGGEWSASRPGRITGTFRESDITKRKRDD
jgi:hypothetical protein